ncbi:hypothetical protein N7474_004186 [Penicillium riverlandense]|uniref:uncharacterized protein n=1 Tax=Penicillium riverlandense TaxID=1903569 RepID=UPI002549947C|nr:uncharacterized protein N7474_004186 [Penicillium riverlandense]KAJ5818595.1 hypothetical protein N7474_004186 [Penicillium riverlandense]
MSTSSRSRSSSPDILGPPGDAEYLISSPAKPFSGRQSWLPADTKHQSTPPKRRRISLSPERSAHSIRFDDVLLPGSPTMKLDGRQRSLSPVKDHSEGNVSPWRIRVTLEATQDEENQVSPRKRQRSTTVTTKVPLKDERSPLAEKTPRRRGRPRKSDVQALNGSPYPRSPGNTPARPTGTPQKKRGRPRKGTPKPTAQEPPEPDEQPTPSVVPDQAGSPMDIAVDDDVEPPRDWTPMNLEADRTFETDSLGADDLPVADFSEHPLYTGQFDVDVRDTNTGHDYGRATYDTPVVGQTDYQFDVDDEKIHSTPSKIPSPTRDLSILSPKITQQANRAPASQPTYPTPTSSVEEDNQTGEDVVEEIKSPRVEQNRSADPTSQHREFDSIMEGEGFSMVSLDTLPSAKQHGLASSSRLSSNGALRPFLDRENGGPADRLKRKLPGSIAELRGDRQASRSRSPQAKGSSPGSLIRSRIDAMSDRSPINVGRSPAGRKPDGRSPVTNDVRYSELSRSLLAGKPPNVPKKRPLTSLARLVRVGMALMGPFKSRDGELSDFRNTARKSRLEDVFSTFSPDTQRELRAALGLGQELARRQSELEEKRDTESVSDVEDSVEEDVEEDEDEELDDVHELDEVEVIPQPPQSEQRDRMDSITAQREAEWQREREAVSRQAQTTSAKSMIYIDSDEGGSPVNEDEAGNAYDGHSQADFDQEEMDDDVEAEVVPEPRSIDNQEPDVEPEIFDDGFDDIWQQEARDNSQVSHQSEDRHLQPLESDPVSPWRRIATSISGGSSSPSQWNLEQSTTPYLGRSHIHKLREEEVDLSALLAEEDTPNRARYYNGTSTPRSATSHRSLMQPSPINGSAVPGSSQRLTARHDRLQPLSQSSPVSSPERGGIDSPTTQHRSLTLEDQEDGNDFDSSASDGAPLNDPGSVHKDLATTPDPEQPANGETPASSWFQRITNLTPRWLRAPARGRNESVSSVSEDENEEDEDLSDEERDVIEPAGEIAEHRPQPISISSDESPSESPHPPSRFEQHNRGPEVEETLYDARRDSEEAEEYGDENDIDEEDAASGKPGYFSDVHYNALRRVYRMAKRFPERFQYYDAPGRAHIIGDWIWTSDGHHGVPITQLQFAIIDRFTQGLSRADVQSGGDGQVDWTEADLHRRLISIIIGEQIREEKKAKALRGASVDTWR